jgi:transcriptional regulator with XRE-family HTH domain
LDNYGSIVSFFRLKNKLTRAQLAQDICTEEYIYLVETNKRVPSVRIFDKICQKLNVNFSDYYEYVHLKKPIIVKKLFDELFDYNFNSNFNEQKSILSELRNSINASEDKVIATTVILYELILNLIHGKGECDINYLVTTLSYFRKLEYRSTFFYLNMNLLAIMFSELGKNELAKEILTESIEEIEHLPTLERYEHNFVDMLMNLEKIYLMENEYKKAQFYADKTLDILLSKAKIKKTMFVFISKIIIDFKLDNHNFQKYMDLVILILKLFPDQSLVDYFNEINMEVSASETTKVS